MSCNEEQNLNNMVDELSRAMKTKLRGKLYQGYEGWDDSTFITNKELHRRLKDAVKQRKYVNAANFSAMLYRRVGGY